MEANQDKNRKECHEEFSSVSLTNYDSKCELDNSPEYENKKNKKDVWTSGYIVTTAFMAVLVVFILVGSQFLLRSPEINLPEYDKIVRRQEIIESRRQQKLMEQEQDRVRIEEEIRRSQFEEQVDCAVKEEAVTEMDEDELLEDVDVEDILLQLFD